MKKKLSFSSVKSALFFLLFFSLVTAGEVVFEKQFSASGTQEFVIPLKSWGRFSFIVESEQGTSLQLIDRKVGRRSQSGVPGQSNGRIDEYLDKGEYKVVASSSHKGTGKAVLKVVKYTEINSSPEYLVPYKEYAGELNDGQQISYWLYLEKDTTVFFEALGRSVDDVQLWKEGQWRVELNRSNISAYPKKSQPLKGYRVVQKLPAGYYQLTTYAGKSAEWSDSSVAHPFYLKMGAPQIAPAGAGQYTIPAKGYLQFRVSGAMRTAVLSANSLDFMQISVLRFSNSKPNFNRVQSDSIHKKLNEPRCIVRPGRSSGDYIVKVNGKPGDPFTLKTFAEPSKGIRVHSGGDYWISTVHSGSPQDQIGVSGGIVVNTREREIVKLLADTVSGEKQISRRFNLMGSVSLYLWVAEKGKYTFTPGEMKVKCRVERFYLDGADKKPFDFSEKKSIPLEKGLYLISLTPRTKGIATLNVKKASIMGTVMGFVAPEEVAYDQVRASLQIPRITLRSDMSYTLFQNSLSPEISSTIIRELPIDPTQPLSLYLKKGESISIPLTLAERSQLILSDEKGKRYSIALSGKSIKTPALVDGGTHTAKVIAPKTGLFLLQAEPEHRLSSSAPKAFPTGDESPLPIFPTLSPDNVTWLDMKRNETRIYEFEVEEPGIYAFETTGRLRTSLRVRDRFIVKLTERSENGVGRNAALISYLLPGRYQTSVSTLGKSTGRCGLSLKLQDMIDGGTLTELREKRHQVPAGKAISYSVPIGERGEYTLESLGQQGYFKARFDDSDGWPVVLPGSSGEHRLRLTEDEYQFISLPEIKDRLRIARIKRIEEARDFSGKGPHQLPLNRSVSSVWMDGEPVEFSLDIPASVPCNISVTAEFDAVFYDAESGDSVFTTTGSSTRTLATGAYKVSLFPQKEMSNTGYQISVSTDHLVPGQSKYVSQNATIPVSVGKQSLVEIFSQGMNDVAGYLSDSSGLITWNDDATNDWNFKISRVLKPGDYSLRVTGRQGRGSIIKMSVLEDTLHENWQLDTSIALDLEGKTHNVELSADTVPEILVCALDGKSSLGAQIEKKSGEHWKVVGREEGDRIRLSVPTEPGSRYRIGFWSADHLNEQVTAQIGRQSFVDITGEQLKKGVAGVPTPSGSVSYLWYRVSFADSLAHLRFTPGATASFSTMRYTSGSDSCFTVDSENIVPVLGSTLWIGAEFTGSDKQTLAVENVELDKPEYFRLGTADRAFQFPRTDNAVAVVSASMKAGKPQWGSPDTAAPQFYPSEIGVRAGANAGDQTAVHVITDGDDGRMMLWNAASVPGTNAGQAYLSREVYPVVRTGKLKYASWIEELPARSAVKLALPAEFGCRVQVGLPGNSVAVWKRSDGTKTLFASEDELQRVQFSESEGELYLVNRGTAQLCDIECQALPKEYELGRDNRMVHGQFEHYFNTPGEVTIALDSSCKNIDGTSLRYSGSIDRIDWWSREGEVSRALPSGARLVGSGDMLGGFLTIRHGSGWVKVNISEKSESEALWGMAFPEKTPDVLIRPQLSVLKGDTSWFKIYLEKEQHVRLQSRAELVATLKNGMVPLKSYVGMGGLDVDFPLEKGTYTIGVRGLGSSAIAGSELITSIADVLELSDAEPLDVQFAPGQSRLAKFTLNRTSQIGIGVLTNREVLDVELYDSSLKLLGSGQQQFKKLDSGTYYLRLTVPAGEKPAECQIKLVGQNPPSKTPADKIQKFRNLDRE